MLLSSISDTKFQFYDWIERKEIHEVDTIFFRRVFQWIRAETESLLSRFFVPFRRFYRVAVLGVVSLDN